MALIKFVLQERRLGLQAALLPELQRPKGEAPIFPWSDLKDTYKAMSLDTTSESVETTRSTPKPSRGKAAKEKVELKPIKVKPRRALPSNRFKRWQVTKQGLKTKLQRAVGRKDV